MPSADYTYLFTALGKIVKQYNLWLSYQDNDLMGTGQGADEIITAFGSRPDLYNGIYPYFDQLASAVAGWCGTLTSTYANRLLADLRTSLAAPSADASAILAQLAVQMTIDGQTIKANTVGTPTVATGSGGSTGNGIVVASALNGDDVNDQRIIAEQVVATFTGDTSTGATSGSEPIRLVGYPKQSPANSYKTRGSGTSNLSVGNGQTLISGGTFETFTSNVPSGWTLAAGTAGTNVAQESTNFFRGAGALKLIGDGSTATVTLTQTLSGIGLLPKTVYCLNVWIRKNGTVNSGSTLQVKVSSTTASYNRYAYNADPNGLTTSYAAKTVFFATGETIPSDLTLSITWTSANSAGASAVLLLDDVVLVRPAEFGHVQYASFSGSTDWVAGDEFYVTTTNNYAGLFSTFLGRVYDVTLPVSGSPTISDSLAS